MNFALYVPFEFPSNGSIKDPLPCAGFLFGYPARIFQNPPYYAVEIRNLESEHQATALLAKLEWALHYAAIESRTAVRMNSDLQVVYYPTDPSIAAQNMGFARPKRIEAVIDGAQSAIYLEGKEVSWFTGQRASCQSRIPEQQDL